MSADEQASEGPAKLGHPVEAKAVPDFYINVVGFTLSAYDVLLEFAIRTGTRDTQPVVKIRMSPQHAKVMSRLFARQVQAYEQEIGPIYLPAKLLEELRLDDPERH